jgi:hypothetical protein
MTNDHPKPHPNLHSLTDVTLVAAASEAWTQVDANIITALDASASVGRYEEWVEREGLAQALAHPHFLEVIRSGPHKRIGFAVFTWSSHGHTKMLVPWTTIAAPEDAERVSNHLRSIHLIEESLLLDRDIPTDHYEPPTGPHQTDIALAIKVGSAHLGSAPSASRRSVINIVGNGPSNSGVDPALARDAALNAGWIVNGLVVGYALGSDVEYYRRHVIGGPGSFVLQVSNLHEVSEAFLAKFRLDIAGLDRAAPSDERFLTAYTTTDQPDQ